MAGTLDQQQTSTNSTGSIYSGSSSEYTGQGVQAGLAGPIVQVDLLLQKSGSPTGNFAVELWSRDGSGLPSAKVSDTTLKDVSTLQATATWESFTITGSPTYAVTDVYCIVIYYSGGNSSNKITISRNTPSAYANGIASVDTDGASWTAQPTIDLAFKTYVQSAASGYKNMLLMGVG